VDKAPAQVWATPLDEGSYLCSESTMYRILRETGGVRERPATHPPRTRLELAADAPGQVWSRDVTKLNGPIKGIYYDLYVIIDIYSRYVPGWLVALTETGDLARALIEATITAAGAAPRVVHADRGTWMTSEPVALRHRRTHPGPACRRPGRRARSPVDFAVAARVISEVLANASA
jgi:putative transposase